MIPILDLKTQLDRLKEDIDFRIQKVLNHGQYILGPEVIELEEKLANYVVDNNFPLNIMKKKINLLKQKIIYERSHSRY